MRQVQLIAIGAAAAFLVLVLVFTRRGNLRDRQAFVWIILALAAGAAAVVLPQLDRLAAAIGISYMPTFVFMLAFLVVLAMLLYQTTVITKQREMVKRMAQELALLRKELHEHRHSRVEGPSE